MNSIEIKERFEQLQKTVKLAELPFDIIRDPITDFLYDKTIPSDVVKAKKQRALVEVMKMYRPDLDNGWEKNLTRLVQSTYRSQAVSLFKNGDLKGIDCLMMYNWGKQLKVTTIEEIFEPKNFTAFSFLFWNDFEQIYQQEETLLKTFNRYGLTHKDDGFLKDAYFFIANNIRGKNYTISHQENKMSASTFIKNSKLPNSNIKIEPNVFAQKVQNYNR